MRALVLLAGIGLAMASSAPAASEMWLSASLEPPGGDRLLVASDGDSDQTCLWRRGRGPEIGVGQTFRVDSELTLDKITIKVRAPLGMSGVQARLTLGRFSGPEDESMNSPVWSGLAPLPDLAAGDEVYLTFDLDDQHLAAGQYGFLVRFGGSRGVSGGLEAQVVRLGTNGYGPGRAFLLQGADYKGLTDDLVFFLQESDGAITETAPSR